MWFATPKATRSLFLISLNPMPGTIHFPHTQHRVQKALGIPMHSDAPYAKFSTNQHRTQESHQFRCQPRHSFHMNRFLRAHFLAAEAADTFLIVINWRLFFSISEIYCFAWNRTAVYANSAAYTFIRFNIGFLLKYI